MSSKVGYMVNSITREVSIDYEDEEDLIECYTGKSLEIAAMRGKKIALVEVVYPEVFESYKVTIVRPFNEKMTLVTVPNERVENLKDFYKALNMKCVVSF